MEKYLHLGISEYGLLVNVIAVSISGTLDGISGIEKIYRILQDSKKLREDSEDF